MGPPERDRLPEVLSFPVSFFLSPIHPLSQTPRCRLASPGTPRQLHPSSSEVDSSKPLQSSGALFLRAGVFSPSFPPLMASQLPSAAPRHPNSVCPLRYCHRAAWFPCAGVLRALLSPYCPCCILLPCPLPVTYHLSFKHLLHSSQSLSTGHRGFCLSDTSLASQRIYRR